MEKTFNYTNSKESLDKNLNGWSFDFNHVFASAFNLTHKQIGVQIGFTVLTFIISIAIGIIPIVGALISVIFLSACLSVGFATGNYRFEKTDAVDFSSYWDGFKFIGPMSIWGIIKLVASIILVLLFVFLFFGGNVELFTDLIKNPTDLENSKELQLLIIGKIGQLIAISFILSALLFPLVFIGHFIVFFKLSAIDAIQYSYKLSFKNFLGLLVSYILITIILGVGSVITCGLGLLYFYPVLNNATYEMFKQMTSLGETEEETTTLEIETENN